MRVHGITKVALELSSPTRMERYLRDVFGLQLLKVGYLGGEYVRIIGSPVDQRQNPGFLVLYNRPFLPRGRLRHLALGVKDEEVEDVVVALRQRGHYDIDGEDVLKGPDGLSIRIDSFLKPRPPLSADPATRLAEAEVDPDLPCLVRGVHHVALDAPLPEQVVRWQAAVFGMTGRRSHDRRGELISIAFYEDTPPDVLGRVVGVTPLFLRRGIPGVTLNHIAFDMADADAAIGVIEARGAKVDLPGDAMIHGPEEVWFQIDSRDTPFAIGHPANDPGVPLFPYRY